MSFSCCWTTRGASGETRGAGCGHTYPEYLPCSPSRRCGSPHASSLAGRKMCPTHANTFCECLPQNKQVESQSAEKRGRKPRVSACVSRVQATRQYRERNRCASIPRPGSRVGRLATHPRLRSRAANLRECRTPEIPGGGRLFRYKAGRPS